jgi:hypothetical protein
MSRSLFSNAQNDRPAQRTLTMLETTLVLLAVVSVGLVVVLVTVLTPPLVTVFAMATMCLGLAVGVPTGFWYHVILYRVVSPKIPLPRRWWMAPSALHVYLTDAERRRINRWYRIGGVGFVLSVVGGLAAIAGLLLGARS